MGLLRRIRDRVKASKQVDSELNDYPRPPGPDRLTKLPKPLLRLIFTHVCPHSTDMSYEPSESCMPEDACSLCDLGDLANCALVNRACYLAVQDVLYRSIRIDAVHFCPREFELSKKRKKRGVDPATLVPARLRLFQRTAWARPDVASSVQYLKIPYMARETVAANLARTVAALPNLRYVDLPHTFFSADKALRVLREEVLSKCWDLRRMKYAAGAETEFASLMDKTSWTRLEILELDSLDIDAARLRAVLSALPNLIDLRVVNMPRLDDSVFHAVQGVVDFPILSRLSIEAAPKITCHGLAAYASRAEVSESLVSLSLRETSATVATLHLLLGAARRLQYLSFTETVTESFPLDPTAPLASASLTKLNYEITTSDDCHRSSSPVSRLDSPYYAYLAASLLQGLLPRLKRLYVRDPGFPATLIAPSSPSMYQNQRSSQNLLQKPFSQPLELFTKGPEDSDWTLDSVAPPRDFCLNKTSSSAFNARPTPCGRPISAYVATKGSGPRWGGEARKSVIVGNGWGGALALDASEDALTVPVLPKAWD